ncbi:MAG: hypothetical protein ABEI52_09140 [Halobacteriaceae archaeon]
MLWEWLIVARIGVLGASIPLALIAAWGYRGTPFGRVLRPLSILSLAFILSAMIELIAEESELLLSIDVIGLILIAWATIEFVLLVTERRQL